MGFEIKDAPFGRVENEKIHRFFKGLRYMYHMYIYIYLNPPRFLKFGPLNHQKQTWGLKFDTPEGSRYIYPGTPKTMKT